MKYKKASVVKDCDECSGLDGVESGRSAISAARIRKGLLSLGMVLTAAAGMNSAWGQSSATLYGSLVSGLRWSNGQNGGMVFGYDRGTYGVSNWGLRGSEDLGDGYRAYFNLRSGFNSGTGAGNQFAFFNTDAEVGVNGPLGSLRLGRQYNVSELIVASMDPVQGATNYVTIDPLFAFVVNTYNSWDSRFNNVVMYSNQVGGLLFGASYALGGVAGNTRANSNYSAGALYQRGVWQAALTYERTYNSTATRWQEAYFGAVSAQIGPTRAILGYLDYTQTGVSVNAMRRRDQVPYASVIWQVTPSVVLSSAFYYDMGRNLQNVANTDGHKMTAFLMAEYYLSKRTELYAEVDRNSLSGAYRSDPLNVASFSLPRGGSGVTGATIGLITRF
ncbi:porin [Paraburkholderia nemoris]|uniref:porin n=1 Tax=Paraburkholderia nemoris TaxID=2793076 RepID=UPI001B8C782B|nr:porin [Paraburkholderia nemoris]